MLSLCQSCPRPCACSQRCLWHRFLHYFLWSRFRARLDLPFSGSYVVCPRERRVLAGRDFHPCGFPPTLRPGTARALQQSVPGVGVALKHLTAECRRGHRAPGPKDAGPSGVSRPSFPSLGSAVGHGDAGAGGLGTARTQGRQHHALHVRRDPCTTPRGSQGVCGSGRERDGTPPVSMALTGARATQKRGHVAGLQRRATREAERLVQQRGFRREGGYDSLFSVVVKHTERSRPFSSALWHQVHPQARSCHHGFRTFHRPEQKLLINSMCPRAPATSTLGARFVLETSWG